MHIKTDHNSTSPRSRVNTLLAAVLITGLSIAAVPAMASTTGIDTVKVRIQAYELAADDATVRVYNKLSTTAERSCATAGRTTLVTKRQDEACTASLLSQFVRDLNNPGVTAYHQQATAQ